MSDTASGKPLVSIIVPVYNVEAYLDRCVESLVVQTLEDIEIILVDDGSTDNGPAMCDAWMQRDDRIRVIHKENGGLSDARNTGAEHAHADWIGFVDSDDYVSPEMFETLYQNAVDARAEVSICGVFDEYHDHTVTPSSSGCFSMAGIEALREALIGDTVIVGIPPKLYTRSIVLNNPMPVGRTYEDAFVIADILSCAQRVVVDQRPLYHYVHREGTITTQPFSSSMLDVIDAYDHVYDVVMRECPQLKLEAELRIYWAHFKVLDKMLLTRGVGKCAEEKNVVSFLRAHATDIQANPYVGRGRKLAMRALGISVRAYKLFAKANARNYQVKQV